MNARFMLVAALSLVLTLTGCGAGRRGPSGESKLDADCVKAGWDAVTVNVGGVDRHLLWKGPKGGAWKNGAIVIMHGGGGEAAHFCAGGRLVQPQVHFGTMALERGFAVFTLDATNDKVTDAQGRPCGKRFDFHVATRANLDLPFIEQVITRIIPSKRPANSNPSIFVTGLSTGGYMTTRAGAELGDKITAFAPVSAGDPFGTDVNCDTSLSPRTSAKGVLTDRETGKEITAKDACASATFAKESPWPSARAGRKPTVKQFQDEDDGIVDLSCMRKATALLERNGYPDAGAFLIKGSGRKSAFKHLWVDAYNAPLLDFFESVAQKQR